MYTLHLGNEQVALGKEGSDGQFVGGRPFTEDTAGKIYSGEWKVSEKGGGKVDFPSLCLNFDYSADDEIADFGSVASS